MHCHAIFCARRINRCRNMADFLFFKIAFLGVWFGGPMCVHCAIFCADRSHRCEDMAVFRFHKMAAVRFLGFLKV